MKKAAAEKKGAIPKVRPVSSQPSKAKGDPSRTIEAVDESTYPCQSCLVTDGQDKVCCDLCQLWYHFKCVNVTSEVEKLHWACATCNAKSQRESTPVTQSPATSNSAVVLIDDSPVSNVNQSNVTIAAVKDSQMAANIENEQANTASQGVVVSQDSQVELTQPAIGTVTSLNVEKRTGNSSKSNKTKSTSSTVNRRTALALQRLEEERRMRERREMDYLDKKFSLLEEDLNDDISESDSELEQVKWDRTREWSKGLPNQPIDNALAQIHLSESTSTAADVRQKAVFNFTSQSNNVCPATSGARDAGSRKSERLSQKSIAHMKAKPSLPSWLTAPSKLTTDEHPWKKYLPLSNISDIPITGASTPKFRMKPPMRTIPAETQIPITNSQSNGQIHSWPVISPVSTSMVNPLYAPLSSTSFYQPVSSNMLAMSNVTSSYTFPPNSQPLNVQSSISPISCSITPASVEKQLVHFGMLPTSGNAVNSSLGQSSATTLTGTGSIFNHSQQVSNVIGSTPASQPSSYHFATNGQGVFSTHVNRGAMTTSRVHTSDQNSHSLVPPLPHSTPHSTVNSSNSVGSTNIGYQPPISSNQTVDTQNIFAMGSAAPNMNNSISVMQGMRLTAEQIAARHVIPKLPKFDGNPRKWYAFKGAFDFATSACGFTDVENLGRLQESLVDDAKESVGCRLIHPDAVTGVMSTLKLLYGRDELIIECLIDDIKKEVSPKDDDIPSLIKFAVSVQNLCGSIRESGAIEHLRNPTLMNAITDKLPTQVKLNWAYHRHSIGVVDLSNLGDWLYGLADVASQIVRTPMTKPKKKEHEKKAYNRKDNDKSKNYLNTQIENSRQADKKPQCLACKSNSCSKIATCIKFKNWSRAERWSFVKDNKLCSKCLGAHSFYRCRSNQSCRAEGCTRKHHTLLHDSQGQSTDNSKSQKNSTETQKKVDSKVTDNKVTSSTDTPSSVCNSQRSNAERTDIFRIVPVVLHHNKKIVRDFAYLDDGSNLTLMEASLASELELVGTPQVVCIDWAFGQSHESEESRIVSTRISGFYHQAPSYKLENVRTVKSLNLPSQSITSAWLERFPYFENVPIATYESAKPRMLIGLQYSKLMVSLETVEGTWNEPIACRTRLGWVVQGPSYEGGNQIQKKISLNMCQCQSVDHQLHQLVKEYFSIENFGVKADNKFLESKEVQRAREILETTTVKKEGRYESGLLWKYDDIDLPNSYNMALKRLQCLESKMTKNPQLAENLCNQINQFLEKGYIRKLSPAELQQKPDREWYLPIFPVFNPKKPEKVRIVWDAAAKVKNVSLNSVLMTGPDLLVPLVNILRQFRERLIAILGDIGEMYHQIRIIEQDQNVQRFLWRNGDATKKPEVYVMLVSTFGAACSPCTAQFVKNKNAKEHSVQFPEAAAAIIHNTYVDDLLDCCHRVEEAIKLAKDVKHVNRQGGFETKNFLSNSKEVLEQIGERNTQSTSKNLNINTDLTLGTERVLGMFWNADTDNFTYSLKYTKVNQNILNGNHCPTKRELLRVLMSIFDPLGLLANFLIYPKLLLQETWRNSIDWDEQIPETLQTKWLKWITVLKDVEKVEIPRLYSPKLSPEAPKSIQLHVFVDASIEAFASAAYLRIEDDDGVDCCLVGAKTKVAPNKPMTVPRLELQAGVLGTRLARSIKHSQRLEIEKVIYWSDSKTVMGWINSDTRRYHQFVAFRIGEILETTETTEWRWVPSEHNVADEATKSKEVQKLDSNSRWFKGPDFLYDEENTWFVEEGQDDHHTQEELKLSIVMACREGRRDTIIDVQRFSQWNRLVRAMAYVYRFIYNLKTAEKRSGPLLQEEILQAENHLYRTVQQEHYLDEIALLERNATLPPDKQENLEKSSELYRSSPYIDDQGVLRVRGRLDAAKCLSDDTKRPIILPRRNYITRLIVNHYHRRYLHINHETAINEIRQKFDIPALRVVMKEIRHFCQKCKNESAVPQIPEMAELPYARLAAFERPYTYVGVDYFGPFKVTIKRNCTAKRWGVIYTCLTTRAIHLEVAHSLSTNSCIMAFERFCTDCGSPREVFSDNGLNFHGMDNELKEEFKKLNQDEIQQTFTNSEMKWSFNPPISPHMGGAWERLIRTVKSCFKKIVTTRNPTDESLPTLLSQVENIVNSRPLTYISLETSNDEALTPNHFLFGSSNGRKPVVRTSPKGLGKEDWKNIQEQTNQFWKRFVLEYMPTLTKRTKWFKNSKPVKVGDVVLIIDERNPRNTWPKGIVESIIRGKGGKYRQAIVRAVLESKNGPVHKEYRRSVHKLAILDVKVPANEEVNRQPVESINGGEPVGQHC